MSKELNNKIEKLQELIDIQCSAGNWDHSPYMHGMANGMLVAMSVLTGESPKFKDAPDMFLDDLKTLDKFNNSCKIVGNAKKSNQDEAN